MPIKEYKAPSEAIIEESREEAIGMMKEKSREAKESANKSV